MNWPESTCQVRIVLSSDAEAKIVESWENETDLTQLLWPLRIRMHFPDSVYHIRIVLSADAEARSIELYENAIEVTQLL